MYYLVTFCYLMNSVVPFDSILTWHNISYSSKSQTLLRATNSSFYAVALAVHLYFSAEHCINLFILIIMLLFCEVSYKVSSH
jgi:hypothetical protein